MVGLRIEVKENGKGREVYGRGRQRIATPVYACFKEVSSLDDASVCLSFRQYIATCLCGWSVLSRIRK